MATRTPTTTPQTFNDVGVNCKRRTLTQCVTITSGASNIALLAQLPAYTAIVFASLKIVTGSLTLMNNGTAGTADVVDLVAGMPTTDGTSTDTSKVVARSGATLTNGTEWQNSVHNSNCQYKENVSTSAVSLYLIPADAGAAVDYSVSTTPTSGFNFGTVTAEVDVELVYDEFRVVDDMLQTA